MTMNREKIQIGISSCLLGHKVRFDGGHKENRYLFNLLSPHVTFLSCCPEVEMGLSTPRQAIRLQGDPKKPQLVFTKDSSIDLTTTMQQFSAEKIRQLDKLDAYILKKDSPSCGMARVKVYQHPGAAPKMGVGLFAQALMQAYPNLPVEDEGRLNDNALRENFIERIFLHHRLRLLAKNITKKNLIDFHSAHKYALMSHSTEAYRTIGQEMADLKNKNLAQFFSHYNQSLMSAFKLLATRKKQSNVLQHLYGYIKKLIAEIDRKELCTLIDNYRLGLLPLIVPVTLIKHHLNHHQIDYLNNQVYLNPYPDELMLRNSVL